MINRLTLVALIDWLWQAFIDDSDRRMDVKMKRMEAYRREHNIEKKGIGSCCCRCTEGTMKMD